MSGDESKDKNDQVEEPEEEQQTKPGPDEEKPSAEEPAAEKEEPAKETEPAAGEGKPGAETQQAIDEMEEGWPRSWIITTAILGIVAIIIIARLVGQSWRREVPPGPPPEMKAPPEERAEGKPAMKVPPPKFTLLLEAKELTIKGGRYCVGKEGNFHPFADDKRPEACAVAVKPGSTYRMEAQRGDSPGEALLQVVPAEPVQPFLLNRLLMPDPGRRIWIGGKMLPSDRPQVMLLFTNFGEEPFKLKYLKLSSAGQTPRPSGRIINRMEARDLELPAEGSFCMGSDNKFHKISGGEDAPPQICQVEVVDARVFRTEVMRTNGNVEMRVALRVAAQGAPPMFEAMLAADPESEMKPSYFEGSLEAAGKVALVIANASRQQTRLKHLLFVVKGQ